MKPLVVLAALAALAAAPAAGAQVRTIDDGRGVNVEKSRSADGKKICKARKVTGSRLSKQKECRTAEEWAKVHEKGKGVHEDLTRKSTTFNCVMAGSGTAGGNRCTGG